MGLRDELAADVAGLKAGVGAMDRVKMRKLVKQGQSVEDAIAAVRHDGNGSPSAEGATADIPDKIKQLAILHDAGVLTDEEFEGKKAELLARL
jgi:Short C-terminal domain